MHTSGSEPLLKWAGGKRFLLAEILPFVPVSYRHYYEPFFGGGAMFFFLQPPSATISDTNFDLIETYSEIRDNVNGVIKFLRRMPNTAENYYTIRESHPRTSSGRAARLIYLCTLSFNGIYRQNLRGEFNVPYGYKKHMNPCDESRLRQIAARLKGRDITPGDFELAIAGAKRGDFIYFDPPYTVAHANNGFVKYNAKIFSWADQKRLADVANILRKNGCKVLVSNADHPSIHELYSNFRTHIIERHSIMAASSLFRRPVRECLFY